MKEGVMLERNARVLLERPPEPSTQYAGLSYRAASRLGQRLCEVAADTGLWRHLPEHLSVLRNRMEMTLGQTH